MTTVLARAVSYLRRGSRGITLLELKQRELLGALAKLENSCDMTKKSAEELRKVLLSCNHKKGISI